MQRRSVLKTLSATAVTAALSPLSPLAAEPAGKPQPASALPPSGLFLNQLGFGPADPKSATVTLPGGSDFRIRSADSNAVAFEGTLSPPRPDAASGDTASQALFSSLATPGLYRLEVAGHTSDPFPIHPTPYAEALRLTLRAFYGQRCGTKVDLGGGYKHGRCHKHGAFHATSGRSGKLRNTGGWHDAGDYGRYVVNSGISTGTLLWAFEMYPEALQSLHLDIPESGRKLPDTLAEIRWNLDWMLSLQDTDGGVWQKQTSEHFCAFIMPQKDSLTSYVIGSGAAPFKTTAATADLAAVAAIAARCYAPFDPAYAQTCLASARRAFAWAAANPDQPFRNPPAITTGDYGDPHPSDELLWAAAELWRTTGEPPYEQHLLSALTPHLDELEISVPSWNNLASFACWTYVMADRPGSAELKSRIREATAAAAQTLITRAGTSGYATTLDLTDYIWGSNSVAANQALLLLVAHRLAPSQPALDAARNNLGYLVGRNCHGISWVTHLGTRPFMHPHHRPSAADNILEPWPGLLSGGPNARPGDEVARKLPPGPPMRMWIDDQRAYSMNEIAINWNAPLVFLLAALNQAQS